MKRLTLLLAILIAVPICGSERSSEWSNVRKQHLAKHRLCALCESESDLEVHHIKPFHLRRDLELEPTNLITLCRSKNWGFNCHLAVGHGGNYRYENPDLLMDIENIQAIRDKYRTFDECIEELETYLTLVRSRVKKYNQELEYERSQSH